MALRPSQRTSETARALLALTSSLLAASCTRAESPPRATAPATVAAPAREPALTAPAAPSSAPATVAAPSASAPAVAPAASAPATVAAPALPSGFPAPRTPWTSACTEALAPASRAELTQTPVRWLLPPSPAMLAHTTLIAGPVYAAASITLDGHTIAIHATNAHMDPPGNTAFAHDDRVRGVGASFTENEAIRVVTWFEQGVSYSVDIECDAPLTDVRCTGTDYARAVAESLTEARR